MRDTLKERSFVGTLIGSCQHRCKLDDAIIYIFDLSWQINNFVKVDKKTYVSAAAARFNVQTENDDSTLWDLIEKIKLLTYEIITYLGVACVDKYGNGNHADNQEYDIAFIHLI